MLILENMSSCCAEPVSKIDFLQAKALNFLKYIKGLSPDAEVQQYIDGFHPEVLIQTISTVVVPIVAMSQIDSSVTELMSHLKVPDDQKTEVKKKLSAYLQMFNDVLLKNDK